MNTNTQQDPQQSYVVGDLALDREGRVCRIVRFSQEDGITFAWVVYPGRERDADAGGRVDGTEADPVFEHAVYDREVCVPASYATEQMKAEQKPDGWGYYRGFEQGLRPLPDEVKDAAMVCPECGEPAGVCECSMPEVTTEEANVEVAERLGEEAAAHVEEAAASFERCDTDGFLSQWASGMNAELKMMQAQLAEWGGIASFRRLVLVDENGKRIEDARQVETKFGQRWRSDSLNVWLPIKWTESRPPSHRDAGVMEVWIRENAPASAKHWSPPGARGMSGATSVRTVVVRTDDLKGGGREAIEWILDGEPMECPRDGEALIGSACPSCGMTVEDAEAMEEEDRIQAIVSAEEAHGEWVRDRIARKLPICLGEPVEGFYGKNPEPWIFETTIVPEKMKGNDRVWITGACRSYGGDEVQGRAHVALADLFLAVEAMAEEVLRAESAAGWDRNA